MALQLKIDALSDVPDELRDAYVKAKSGDGFELDFAQIKEHPGVTTIRKTANDVDKKRIAAEKALDELKTQYGDIDPKAAHDAIETAEKAGEKEMMDAGKVEELLEKKTAKMKTVFEKQLEAKDKVIAELTSGNQSLTGELSAVKIHDAIKSAALEKGARKEALPDIENRAKGTWGLVEGRPVAMDGEEAFYGKSGEPLTIEEWVETLSSDVPHLFEPNKGGGATGSDSRGDLVGGKKISLEAAGDNIAALASGDVTLDR
jgi:hypothetical protein|tara:strand:- start:19775 stop:20554 length:780 start_codon:yes stop_codon:yes gene_type:complete